MGTQNIFFDEEIVTRWRFFSSCAFAFSELDVQFGARC